MRKWYARHSVEQCERKREWRATHPEEARERDRKRYANDRDRRLERMNVYYRTERGREVHRCASRKWKARKNGAGATLTAEQWQAILEAYAGRCAYCGMRTRIGGPNKGNKLTMDHIVPLSGGGTHSSANIVPACWTCNASKHAKLPGQVGKALHQPLALGRESNPCSA